MSDLAESPMAIEYDSVRSDQSPSKYNRYENIYIDVNEKYRKDSKHSRWWFLSI